jgi:biotin transporter BioY
VRTSHAAAFENMEIVSQGVRKMLSVFKDSIRTKRQKALYYWVKRMIAIFIGIAVLSYTANFIGDWSIAIGMLAFFVSYVTVSPVIAGVLCFFEEILGS